MPENSVKQLLQDMKIDDAFVERSYRSCLKEYGDDVEMVMALQLERQGGACPVCKRPFKRKDWDLLGSKFHWFEPGCGCYKKCDKVVTKDGLHTHPGCGRFMIYERFKHLSKCTACAPLSKDYKQEKKIDVGRKKKDFY